MFPTLLFIIPSIIPKFIKLSGCQRKPKKRRFYRKLNGLNKNCESLIFHNKKRGLRLIIYNFAKNFSWDGLKGKKAFRNLNLATVIRAATINSFNVTENENEKLLKAYLRRAKERSEAKKRVGN
ncbi:hypothetical protein NQ317_010549 [Molorchus minor]|uniref:Uncharacterized protein n=1 Tax=Molorchus minor TaxID=1323400 RepID=A0ABQ9JCG3_9CUCU|nr:hypothetical protein NQ317_010549 [Molorchus minor]